MCLILLISDSVGLGIPSQPIGYGDAERLLAVMGGPEVPADWRGQVPRITYRLGPGMADDHQVQNMFLNWLRGRGEVAGGDGRPGGAG